MLAEISLSSALLQALTDLAPTFLLICVVFIILSWIRILVDAMSGRGL